MLVNYQPSAKMGGVMQKFANIFKFYKIMTEII